MFLRESGKTVICGPSRSCATNCSHERRGTRMRVAVIQSNYIPWKGYFDIIHDVDVFIFYDDLQYTKNDWRNRNQIKSSYGLQWLTIPVGQRSDRLICDVQIADSGWQKKHWEKLRHSYARAPFFSRYAPFLEDIYLDAHWDN